MIEKLNIKNLLNANITLISDFYMSEKQEGYYTIRSTTFLQKNTKM